jgi:cell division septum initiation protein DivIVA
MRFSSFNIPLIVLSFLVSVSCSKSVEKDPRVEKLQNEVQALAQQNKELQTEIRQLQTQVQELKDQQVTKAQTQQQGQKMTVDMMKREIRPALEEAIQDIRKKAETPRSGTQFGMRVEYDLKNAFYGLIETGDERSPYQAKVIVTFEKFLESEKESKSYGKGSTMLVFSYRKRKWVLDSAQ